jgi:hypothetical protein
MEEEEFPQQDTPCAPRFFAHAFVLTGICDSF